MYTGNIVNIVKIAKSTLCTVCNVLNFPFINHIAIILYSTYSEDSIQKIYYILSLMEKVCILTNRPQAMSAKKHPRTPYIYKTKVSLEKNVKCWRLWVSDSECCEDSLRNLADLITHNEQYRSQQWVYAVEVEYIGLHRSFEVQFSHSLPVTLDWLARQQAQHSWRGSIKYIINKYNGILNAF